MISKYLPDYGENELSDWYFSLSVISTLCQNQIQFLVKKAKANKSINIETDKNEMIEIRESMMSEINNLLIHPSKLDYLNPHITATPRKGVFLLKAKVKQHKKSTVVHENIVTSPQKNCHKSTKKIVTSPQKNCHKSTKKLSQVHKKIVTRPQKNCHKSTKKLSQVHKKNCH